MSDLRRTDGDVRDRAGTNAAVFASRTDVGAAEVASVELRWCRRRSRAAPLRVGVERRGTRRRTDVGAADSPRRPRPGGSRRPQRGGTGRARTRPQRRGRTGHAAHRVVRRPLGHRRALRRRQDGLVRARRRAASSDARPDDHSTRSASAGRMRVAACAGPAASTLAITIAIAATPNTASSAAGGT